MKNLPFPANEGWSRCHRSWVQRLVENGPLGFVGESILKLWDAIFQNVISGAESCKPFLSIGISKKFPLTESLILQSKPTLCTFNHHPVYRDKFQVYIEEKKVLCWKIGVALTKAERSLIRRRRCVSCVRVIKRIIKTQSLITRVQFVGSETITFKVSVN